MLIEFKDLFPCSSFDKMLQTLAQGAFQKKKKNLNACTIE